MKLLGISVFVTNGFIALLNLFMAFRSLSDGRWIGLLNLVGATVSACTMISICRSMKRNQKRLAKIDHDILETFLSTLEYEKPKGWELVP